MKFTVGRGGDAGRGRGVVPGSQVCAKLFCNYCCCSVEREIKWGRVTPALLRDLRLSLDFRLYSNFGLLTCSSGP